MPTDPTTPEGRAELRQMLAEATDGPWEVIDERGMQFTIGEGQLGIAKVDGCLIANDFSDWSEGCETADAALIVAAVNALPALLDQLDEAECEIERQRGDLVIERRRAEAAEAAIARVRALAYSDAVGYSEEERIIAALDGES